MFRTPDANIPKNHNFGIFDWGLDSILKIVISEVFFFLPFPGFDSLIFHRADMIWKMTSLYMLTLGEKSTLGHWSFDLTC